MAFTNSNKIRHKINPLMNESRRVKIKRGLSFRKRRRKFNLPNLHGKLFLVLELVLSITLAFFVVECFGIRIEIIGESMENTLSDGDSVLLNRLGTEVFKPESGSLVAFVPGGSEDASPTVKRIIGVPHDRVHIENGAIYVNDRLFEDSTMADYIEEAGLAAQEIVLGKNEYFVMGDNRNNSQDSRYESVGNIHRQEMLGTVWFMFAEGQFGFVQ